MNQLQEQLNKGTDNIHVVAVATPDSYVAGDGDYRTLFSDWLIRSIPGALPNNVTNKKSGFLDHEFITHYMNGDPSGQQIIDLIFEGAKTVASKNYYFEPGYLHQSLVAMNKWVKNLANGHIKRKLMTHECLGVSLFLKNANWFGESCENRNLELIKKGAQKCFKSEWSNPIQIDFEYLKWIWNFPKISRPKILNRIQQYAGQATVVHLKTNHDIETFINS